MNQKIFDQFLQSGLPICFDSRMAQPGQVFFALPGEGGERGGADYVGAALDAGCVMAVTDNEEVAKTDDRITLVPDSLRCLHEVVAEYRKRFQIPVIGISGNNGKTTTKELAAAALSTQFKTLATEKSYNSKITLPYMVSQLTKHHQAAVFEIGASYPGETKTLCQIAEPTVGLCTNLGTAHIGNFGDKETAAKTESSIYDYLHSTYGIIMVNIDDQELLARLPEGAQPMTYSALGNPNADVVISHKLNKSGFAVLEYDGQVFETTLLGSHNATNAAAAAALAVALGIQAPQALTAIAKYTPSMMRSQVINHPATNTTIIYDVYNANLENCRAALDTLAAIDDDRQKIAILGDMRELGDYAADAHREIHEYVQKLGIAGYFGGAEYSAALTADNVFPDKSSLVNHLKTLDLSYSTILMKASRGEAFEKVFQELFPSN